MGCDCNKAKDTVVAAVKDNSLSKIVPYGRGVTGYRKAAIKVDGKDVKAEAVLMDLEQCYLCAKKHISAAKILFREYHTGYPAHVKNLINSMRISEDEIRCAFLLWQDIMAELNMGEAELLGKDESSDSMDDDHVKLANKIRDQRIRLSDDPLYVPDFDSLLVDIHILQFRSID